MERKYNYTLPELLDRLSIVQLKEMLIPNHKEEYASEIAAILSDIQSIIDANKICINADILRNLIVLAQINTHIWHNEANYRKGIKEGNSLELTHGLNGIRNTAKNKIASAIGGRKDYKIDCLAAEFSGWLPSGYSPAEQDL